jgi:hypothetical protein
MARRRWALASLMRTAYNRIVKDAILTLRLPRVVRLRLEAHAAKEGRSLSQAAARLIERGLDDVASAPQPAHAGADSIREPSAATPSLPPLAGLFAGGVVPSLADMRAVRDEISASLLKRTRLRGRRRR